MNRRFHCKKVEQVKQEVVILSGVEGPHRATERIATGFLDFARNDSLAFQRFYDHA
jgi:hypothetical protein